MSVACKCMLACMGHGDPSSCTPHTPMHTAFPRPCPASSPTDFDYCSQTKALTAELLGYNPDTHVFGYLRIDFRWKKDGGVQAHIQVGVAGTALIVREGAEAGGAKTGLAALGPWAVVCRCTCGRHRAGILAPSRDPLPPASSTPTA